MITTQKGNRSFRIFEILYMIQSDESVEVREIYKIMKNYGVPRQNIYHVLSVLERAYVIAKDRSAAPARVVVFIPPLFFRLSREYSNEYSEPLDARAFIEERLRIYGVEWCYSPLMRFMEIYGDIIAFMLGVMDAVYNRPEQTFRSATLLATIAKVLPEPYSRIVPDEDRGFFEKISVSVEALRKIRMLLKERIAALTSQLANPAFNNARNIVSSYLFYTLVSIGSGRITSYREDTPDPHLALLINLNKNLEKLYLEWEKALLTSPASRGTQTV